MHFKSTAISHLWKPVSLVLSLTILFSCGLSKSQKIEGAGIDTIQFKNASGVPASPARVAIPLPLPDNRITSTYDMYCDQMDALIRWLFMKTVMIQTVGMDLNG
jgi:hypothetical protein